MSTIHMDVADDDINAFLHPETSENMDGENAFLTSFADKDADAKKKPSDADEEDDDAAANDTNDAEGSEETPDELDADDEDGDTPEDAKDEAAKTYVDDDGHFVKIKVGEEEKEVSVKDLKRLFGQEASLTHKSTEVANARKLADADAEKYSTSLKVLLQRATEKATPYRNIDWLAVSKDTTISQEAASALREEAQRALDDEAFLGQNLNAFMNDVNERKSADRVESAKLCVKALTTAPTDAAPNEAFIKNWNPQTYEDVRSFGVSMGIPQEAVNTLTDPVAIKIMHMAMLFKKGASKVVTTSVNKTPKKIVKTSSSPAARPSKGSVANDTAMKTLKRSGSVEAAQDAFLSSFADK